MNFIRKGRNSGIRRDEEKKTKATFESSQSYSVLDESRSILAVDIFRSFFGIETRKERSYDLFEIQPNPRNNTFGHMGSIPIVLPIPRKNLNNRIQKTVPLLDVYDFFRNDPLYLSPRDLMPQINKKNILLRPILYAK